jgi:DNA-binding transcriptional MerR regulator
MLARGKDMPNKDLLSISEFSQLTGIRRSKLIYYDQIGLFPPAARGDNNYRYYSLEQIILVNFIDDMAAFGIPLRSMIKLMHNRTPQTILDLMQEKAAKTQVQIKELLETLDLIKVTSIRILEGLNVDEDAISVMRLHDVHYILGDENEHQDANDFYPAWLAFMASAQQRGLNLRFPIGGYFDSMERFVQQPQMPSRFYFVHPSGDRLRPAGDFLVAYARGFYGQPGEVAPKMLAYAQEHDLKLTGPVSNTFLLDEFTGTDPKDYLMRVDVRVEC